MSITPEELIQYSSFSTVQERDPKLLELDILESETYIGKQLEKPLEEHVPLPKKLSLALLKVAQYFALVNSDESMVKGIKSEKIGDYSYTLADGSKVSMPDISDLIENFVKTEETSSNGFFMRIRSL